jgi:DNA-3-methyladenine glycosylase I
MTDATQTRCQWCGDDPLYVAYHDEELGVPLHDERRLFEMLVLEGAQAGLSWLTVLRKRENYRKAFANFDLQTVARFTPRDVDRLRSNPGIIRNRLKIESAIRNAQVVIAITEQYGSLDAFLWRYVDGTPIQNAWTSLSDIPPQTDLSVQMSKDLKRMGCNFVGPTICYAYMQSIGMVNDHITDCFRHSELREHAVSSTSSGPVRMHPGRSGS